MMKQILLIVALFCVAFSIMAEDPIVIQEAPFVPTNPVVMGQGASYTGASHGYNALFYNPAGFAIKPGSVTIASASAWVYLNPARFSILMDMSKDQLRPEAQSLLNEQLTTGGFGVGASAGSALVGRNWGIGMMTMVDSYLYGKNLLGVEGDVYATAGAILGYARPFHIGGMRLIVGADVKPMLRVHAPLPNEAALGIVSSLIQAGDDPLSVLNTVNAFQGTALGIDAGALLELGGLRVGVAVRDIGGTQFAYKESQFSDIWEGLQAFSLPEGTEVPENIVYEIPMMISAGAAFHPDLKFMKYIFDPTVHIDLQDPMAVINGKSPWTLIHIGGEVKLLSLVTLRGGFNQGYLTAGAGVKLWFLEANASVFTRELGQNIGDRPNSGVTFEAAIRF